MFFQFLLVRFHYQFIHLGYRNTAALRAPRGVIFLQILQVYPGETILHPSWDSQTSTQPGAATKPTSTMSQTLVAPPGCFFGFGYQMLDNLDLGSTRPTDDKEKPMAHLCPWAASSLSFRRLAVPSTSIAVMLADRN